MKKNRFTGLLLSLLVLLGGLGPGLRAQATGAEPDTSETTQATQPEGQVTFDLDASVANGCHSIDAQKPMRNDPVLTSAKAGILYEVNSQTLMFAANADAAMDPGGLVKLMTALIALENGALNQQIPITAELLSRVPENSMTLGLVEGETLTLEELLYCTVVYSANDAAVAVAEHISGNQADFVAAMNQKAAELGCTNTHFVNVHGIHDDDQYTTVRDLTRIVECALQYDTFREIIGVDQYILRATEKHEERTLNSSNYMRSTLIREEYYDSRVTGGRSANIPSGERTLVVTAEESNLLYIGIVAGTTPVLADDGSIRDYREFVEMKALLDIGFDDYEAKQILYEGQITGSIPVTNGENNVAVGPTRSVKTVLPADVTFDGLTLRFQRGNDALTAPVAQGQVLDILQVWYGQVCVAQSELVALNPAKVVASCPQTGVQDSEGLDTEGLGRALTVFAVIVGVIVGTAAILYIVRWVRTAALRSKRRRRRSGRRRSQ